MSPLPFGPEFIPQAVSRPIRSGWAKETRTLDRRLDHSMQRILCGSAGLVPAEVSRPQAAQVLFWELSRVRTSPPTQARCSAPSSVAMSSAPTPWADVLISPQPTSSTYHGKPIVSQSKSPPPQQSLRWSQPQSSGLLRHLRATLLLRSPDGARFLAQ